MSNMASFQPFITYWQVGRDLKNVPSNMKLNCYVEITKTEKCVFLLKSSYFIEF